MIKDCKTTLLAQQELLSQCVVSEEGAEPEVGDICSNSIHVYILEGLLLKTFEINSDWKKRFVKAGNKILQRNGKQVIYKRKG